MFFSLTVLKTEVFEIVKTAAAIIQISIKQLKLQAKIFR